MSVRDWARRSLGRMLTSTKAHLLQSPRCSATGVVETIHQLDASLRPPQRALRAIESFGDSYILLLVPRDKLDEFDRTCRHWLV